jgi:protein-tyrosine phosphatase/nicotinamidase-related amidase
MPSILITQCLQNDFVKPIGKYETKPNLLHVGYEESRRLMGLDANYGPVSLFMNWANDQTEEELIIIHIRDWHNENDPAQKEHLDHFGRHCIQFTEGADFAFEQPKTRKHYIVDATGLNDFLVPELETILSAYKKEEIKVGIAGVWTEAKVFFLAYDVISRYPNFNVSVCSALCASQSVYSHHSAMEQMKSILGINVYDSYGEFGKFLSDKEQQSTLPLARLDNFPDVRLQFPAQEKLNKMTAEEIEKLELSSEEMNLIHYLFRDCRSVELKRLGGGYSGSKVFFSSSIDQLGRSQVQHVVKISTQKDIGKERTAFEKVEAVLGNNAPMIADFADLGEKGAIKYRYASMGSGASSDFQKKFMSGADLNEIKSLLDTVFVDQLGRLYRGKKLENRNLLDYYRFHPDMAAGVNKWVSDMGVSVKNGEDLHLPYGLTCPNLVDFYSEQLGELLKQTFSSNFYAFVHGDLNGKNITVDAQNNIWIIDFFHTDVGHLLKDLLKLENDLLYIFTPLQSEEDLKEAVLISKILFDITDLQRPLPDIADSGLTIPALIRTYETLRILRSYYPALIESDRNPLQTYIGLLRYSVHTLSFDESNRFHKIWALYNSGHYCRLIRNYADDLKKIRIDWIRSERLSIDAVGLTILPGRKDWSRDLDEDIKEIKRNGITKVMNFITMDEHYAYGVSNLNEFYEKEGLEVYHLPILDQMAPTQDQMHVCIDILSGWIADNEKVMLHCVGGLGRSGLVAACYLKKLGMESSQAIDLVRKSRSIRAIESAQQEQFVQDYMPK